MTRVGIIGASGYAAADLMRLLLAHPHARIVALADLPDKCGPLPRLFPQFAGRLDIRIATADPKTLAADCDVVFLALPHTASMTYAGPLLAAGARVIDFSADYRLQTPGLALQRNRNLGRRDLVGPALRAPYRDLNAGQGTPFPSPHGNRSSPTFAPSM